MDKLSVSNALIPLAKPIRCHVQQKVRVGWHQDDFSGVATHRENWFGGLVYRHQCDPHLRDVAASFLIRELDVNETGFRGKDNVQFAFGDVQVSPRLL